MIMTPQEEIELKEACINMLTAYVLREEVSDGEKSVKKWARLNKGKLQGEQAKELIRRILSGSNPNVTLLMQHINKNLVEQGIII